MTIKQHTSHTTLTVNDDELYEIMRALESHKRKLGRIADKAGVQQVYNNVEQMISELSAKTGMPRTSVPYKL